VPVGGTEQSGPHMALGKHNVRATCSPGGSPTELGNALVAPVVAYVPEGDVAGTSGHIRFAGTISVRRRRSKACSRARRAAFAAPAFATSS
jgi:creatinine amidohydrolase/Fe(II)-dependent formamide hydrolase-like protein